MCRAEPGPRCPKHARGKIKSHLARRDALRETIASSEPASAARAAALDELAEVEDKLLLDHNDLNSTPTQQKKLSTKLEQLLKDDPNNKQVPQLARNLATGRLLYAERMRQKQLMPRLNQTTATPAARAAWTDLGQARADMARYKVRMDMNGADYDTWRKWQHRHYEAAKRAETAAAQFDTINKNGPSSWQHLDTAQRDAARVKVAKEADFSSPVAPRPITEVFSEFDNEEAASPKLVDPDVTADVEELPEDEDTGNPDDTAGPPDQTEEPTEQRPSGSVNAPNPRPSRRRARGALSAKSVWANAKRRGQSLDSKLGRGVSSQGDNEELGHVVDPTGISMLLTLFSRGRS